MRCQPCCSHGRARHEGNQASDLQATREPRVRRAHSLVEAEETEPDRNPEGTDGRGHESRTRNRENDLPRGDDRKPEGAANDPLQQEQRTSGRKVTVPVDGTPQTTYPTYNKWLMYEFAGDSGPDQGHGEGIKSFGGTWYALDSSGNLVMPGASGSPATTAANSAGGGNY